MKINIFLLDMLFMIILLLNRALREKTEQMAQNAEELSLSTSPSFMDYYIDCMAFDEF